MCFSGCRVKQDAVTTLSDCWCECKQMRKCWIRHFSNLGCYRGNRLRHTCQQLAYSSFIFDSVASWTWLLQRKRLPSSPTVRLWLSCGRCLWEFASVTWDKLQLFQLSSPLLHIRLSCPRFWTMCNHIFSFLSNWSFLVNEIKHCTGFTSASGFPALSSSGVYRNVTYPFWKLVFVLLEA